MKLAYCADGLCSNAINSPGSGSQTGDTLVLGDLALVNGDLGKLSGLLVPLDRLGTGQMSVLVAVVGGLNPINSHDRVDVDITTEVTRQITEVGSLLNDGTHVDRLVPPCGLGDCFVGAGLDVSVSFISSSWRRGSTHVTSVGRHDGKVVLVYNLLHLLDTTEVSEHVADRDDVAVVDETLGDGLGPLNGTGTDGLV